VQDTAVLDIRALSYENRAVIPPQYRLIPDIGIHPQAHIPN